MKISNAKLALAWLGAVVALTALAEVAPSPSKSTEQLTRFVYSDPGHRYTTFCGCQFDTNELVYAQSCAGRPVKGEGDDAVVWLNAMPSKYIERMRCPVLDPACAANIDRLASDAHGLFPAIAALKDTWGGRTYAVVPGEARRFGRCNLEVEGDRIEPTGNIQGDLARATLYLSEKYRVPLTSAEREILIDWHQADPADAFERMRNAEITRFQGDSNPWVMGDDTHY